MRVRGILGAWVLTSITSTRSLFGFTGHVKCTSTSVCLVSRGNSFANHENGLLAQQPPRREDNNGGSVKDCVILVHGKKNHQYPLR